MSRYPMSPIGASCNRTVAMWCPEHGCPLVEVASNAWDCPMGALSDLAAMARSLDIAATLTDEHERALRILDAAPAWPKDYVAMTAVEA